MAEFGAAEVIAAPYVVHIAPVGTPMPAITAKESEFVSGGAWKTLGKNGSKNYSEAGITVTQAHGQFISAGGIVPRKKWRTEEGMTIQFDLVDLSPTSYAQIMDEAKVTTITGSPGEEWFNLYRGIHLQFYALCLRGTSTRNEEFEATGEYKFHSQYNVFAACMNGNPAPKFSLKQGPAMLTVQFDVLEIEAGKWAEFHSQ